MLLAKYFLLSGGITMFVASAAILSYDAYRFVVYRRRVSVALRGHHVGGEPRFRWRTSVAMVMLAWAPILISVGLGMPKA